ncbi:MAG TPA: hypothetical protein VL494_13680 [Steroidobacteraceae bacterium]|jgi:hypothetical protein|nr:hypothetical protein [Steroidobacteraceae bacterium]
MSISASRRDRYRRIANRVRAIPGKHGLREHSVEVVIATTSGARTGDGTRSENAHQILESGYPPKVRWLNNQDLALGQLPIGTVDIGPITPIHSSGGTAIALADGSTLAIGDVEIIRIFGPQHPNGADYRKISMQVDHALHWMIRAILVGSQV